MTVSLTALMCTLVESTLKTENTSRGFAAYIIVGAALCDRPSPAYISVLCWSVPVRQVAEQDCGGKISWCRHMRADRLYYGVLSAFMPVVSALEVIQAEMHMRYCDSEYNRIREGYATDYLV